MKRWKSTWLSRWFDIFVLLLQNCMITKVNLFLLNENTIRYSEFFKIVRCLLLSSFSCIHKINRIDYISIIVTCSNFYQSLCIWIIIFSMTLTTFLFLRTHEIQHVSRFWSKNYVIKILKSFFFENFNNESKKWR